MASGSTTAGNSISRRHCYLLLTATVMTYLLITMGGVVCVSESGRACPDWPGCYGRMVPLLRLDAVIEYTHRLIAGLTSPFIIAAAIVGWRQSRSVRWVSRPPAIAVVFLFAVVIFGAMAVLRGLSPLSAAIDLGLALLVLALLVTASVIAFARRHNPELPDRLSFRRPFARLSLWMLGAVFVVLVSGVLIDSGSIARCLGWPIYRGRLDALDLHGSLRLGRVLLGGVTSLLIVAVVFRAWRTRPRQPEVARGATILGLFLFAEISLGAIMLVRGSNLFLLVLYVAMAAAIWASSVCLVVLAGLPSHRWADSRFTAQATAA